MEYFNNECHLYNTDGQIVVRCAQITDAERLSQYFVENRNHLMQWEPKREEALFTELGWLQRLIKLTELHKMKLGYYLLIVDEQNDELLGTISFSNLTRFPFYACNVGYSLAKNVQGQGIMTRALTMACQYMFREHNFHRIQASYMPHNKRSENVLKRVGFVLEGHAKDYLLINGQWEDHVLTALINPDWKG